MELDKTPPPFSFEDRLTGFRGRTVRNQVAQARVTQREYEEISSAAAREGRAVGEWTREVLLREARKPEADPIFTELIAIRTLLNLSLKHIACGETLSVESYSALLAKVRSVKRKQAFEVMQQYTSSEEKES